MIFEVGLPRKLCNATKDAIDFINRCNGIKAVYKTVYKFESMIEKKPDYNSAIIDRLFFDFDSKECWNETNKLHKELLKDDIKHTLTMSGKGYHVFIFTNEYKPRNSKATIYNAQHHFIDKLNLDCDRQVVGDNARLHRVPNTFNNKSKRFCIPLTQEQFYSGDEVIKAAAQKQNFISNKIIGTKLFNILEFDKDIKFKDEFDIKLIVNDNENANYMKECPQMIRELLLKNDACWKERYIIILYFKEVGYTMEEVGKILKDNLSEKKYRHCIREERQLQYIFERDDLIFPDKYGIKIYK